MTKILITDDHPMVVEGLKTVLSSFENMVVAATASNAYEAIEILKKQEIDICLLDINLPDISGLDLCKKIKAEFQHIKIITITTHNDRSFLVEMLQNGVSGYLLKTAESHEILAAIQTALQGGLYIDKALNHTLTPPVKAPKNLPFLTKREIEVLKQIANGYTNQQIADKIFVSVTTVNTHRSNLMLKLDAHNTAQLLKIATQNKLI